MTTCPACTTELPYGARFCVNCGTCINQTGLAPTSFVSAPNSSTSRPPPLTPYMAPHSTPIERVMPPMVITMPTKNIGIAILLTVLFGPLGMFYSTIGGAITMCVVSPFLIFGTLGIGALIIWPICVIWAAVAADSYNKQLLYGRYPR